MNILQVITGNDNGGGANHVLNICDAPIEYFNCHLCCVGKGPLYDKAKASGLEVLLLEDNSIDVLINYIREKNIELINFHGARANFYYGIHSKKLSIPCAVTIHSNYKLDFKNKLWKYYLYTPLLTRSISKFKYHIGVSQYIKNMLIENNVKGKKYVIQNGIDISEPIPEVDKNIIPKLVPSYFTIVCAARYHPVKNHLMLLRAFKKLANIHRDVHLVLIGDGDLQKEIDTYIDSNGLNEVIIQLGYKSDILKYYRQCDISALISLDEGGFPPMVVLESGLCQVPVICSRVGDNEAIITPDCGFLVNPKDEEEIFHTLLMAYENRESLKSMGKALKLKVQQQFSMQNFWDKYKDIYEDIIKEDTTN